MKRLVSGLVATAAILVISTGAASAEPGNGNGNANGHATAPGQQTEITEDNDNDGVPNNIPDEGDNAHPSGRDRSIEHGNSGNQGNAQSDPDDNGNGPDRSNGGQDQPGGPGGVDVIDQDGNNGCGNDDDFEDDNEGNCGGNRPTNPPPPPSCEELGTCPTPPPPPPVPCEENGTCPTPPPPVVNPCLELNDHIVPSECLQLDIGTALQIVRDPVVAPPASTPRITSKTKLAATGSEPMQLVPAAMALILLGAVITATNRRHAA